MRTQRSALNFATRFMATVVSIGVGFVVTPKLLSLLGDQQFGAFRVALQWLGYLGLFETGMSGAVMTALGRAVGCHDHEASHRIMIAGIRIYIWITALSIIAGLILTLAVPNFIQIDLHYKENFRIALFIGTCGLILLPLSVFRALADASQRGYHLHLLTISQVIVTAVMALWFAYSGMGIAGQMLAVTLGSIPYAIAPALRAHKSFSGLFKNIIRESPDSVLLKELKSLNNTYLLSHGSGIISFQSETILIGTILSSAAATPFVLTQTLIQLVSGQLMAIGNATWAALAQLHAQGDHNRFNERVLEITKLIAMFGSIILVPVAVCNPYFMSLWLKVPQYGGDLLTWAAACAVFLHAIDAFWGWTFIAAGQPKVILRTVFLQTAVNLGASIVFTLAFGLAGPLMGRVFAFFSVYAWSYPMLLRTNFAIPTKRTLNAVARPLMSSIPVAYLSTHVLVMHTPKTWLQLCVFMATIALVQIVILLLFACSRDERRRYLHVARQVLPLMRND